MKNNVFVTEPLAHEKTPYPPEVFSSPSGGLAQSDRSGGTLKGVALATMLLLGSQAHALGLGRLSVQSNLGEPLRAEIDVASISAEEAANFQAKVASPDAYRAAGVDYNAVLPGAKVSLHKRADGKSVLRVTSDRVVQEPFVDVILEISSSSGRLVREYTMLFDPAPTVRASTPAADVAVPVISKAEPEPSTKPEKRAAAESKSQAVQPDASATPRRSVARAPSRGAKANVDEYKVRPGDSLSRIAAQVQKPGVSLDQMLVSLYSANPQAFLNNNMNRLKAGVVLSVPSGEAAKAVSTEQAHQMIKAQSADFGSYRNRLGGAVSEAKVDTTSRKAKGEVTAAVDDTKQNTNPTPDKLTLSKASAKASAPEERLSKELEQKESKARVAELSKNVEDLNKLASASSASQGGSAAASSSVGVTVPVAPPQVASAPVGAGTVASATTTPPPVSAAVVASAPEVVASAPTPEASASVAAAPAASAPVVKPPPPPPAVEEDHANSFFSSSLLLAIGGSLLAVVAVFAGFKLLKRRKKDSGETSFLESRLQPDSFFGASGGQRVDTRDAVGSSSMSYSLSQLDAIGDVDPVAEADVYLAYGRDLQAEEILKEAMRTSPDRLAIRTKLLEVYAKRRDTKGFESLATQLQSLTGGQGEDWSKAQELGRQMEPDNPLYASAGAPPAQPARPTGSPAAPAAVAAVTPPPAVAPSPPPRPPAPVADFQATPPSGAGMDLDLDLGQISIPPGPSPQAPSGKPQTDSLDFHLSTQSGALGPAGAGSKFEASRAPLDFDTKSKHAPSTQGADFDLNLDSGFSTQDPLARKLELAQEFRQIGDMEGARDLLREVIASASGDVKLRAQAMLDDLN